MMQVVLLAALAALATAQSFPGKQGSVKIVGGVAQVQHNLILGAVR